MAWSACGMGKTDEAAPAALKRSVTLRFDVGLLEELDRAAGKGSRTAWLEAAARAQLRGVESGELVASVPRREAMQPVEFRQQIALTVSRLSDLVVDWSGRAVVQKASEARNVVGMARDLVALVAGLELLDVAAELNDLGPEQRLVVLRELKLKARELVAAKAS